MCGIARRLYDFCVVGAGASGVTAAVELAMSGKSVLLLEEGTRTFAANDLAGSEVSWEQALAPGDPARAANPWTARGVGGGTPFFAGISFRYRELDFAAHSFLASDAMEAVWPIGYHHLRACYDEVETRIGVSRAEGADPWQPPSSPAPLPAHDYDERGAILAEAGARVGLRPFPTPLAINSRPYAGRGVCVRCGPCTEHICPVGAKGDVATRLLGDRQALGDLTLRTSARAIRLEGEGPGRVTELEWADLASRHLCTVRARHFVLAANAVQTARLLLSSSSRWAPDGLGNSSGLLGAGLSFKLSGYVHGVRDGDDRPAEGGPHSTVSFTDFYWHEEVPGLLGGTIYQANPVRGGSARTLRLHVLAGDQPMERNRVRLTSGRNASGQRGVLLDYQVHPTDAERLRFLAERAAAVLRAAGVEQVRFEPTGFHRGSRHLHGTCRGGDDPRSSVTDRDGRLHDVDNVTVVDGSVFPFAGGVNPVLTIQANALRIARKLTAGAPSPAKPTVALALSE